MTRIDPRMAKKLERIFKKAEKYPHQLTREEKAIHDEIMAAGKKEGK